MSDFNTSGILESKYTRAVIDYISEKYQDGMLILWENPMED